MKYIKKLLEEQRYSGRVWETLRFPNQIVYGGVYAIYGRLPRRQRSCLRGSLYSTSLVEMLKEHSGDAFSRTPTARSSWCEGVQH